MAQPRLKFWGWGYEGEVLAPGEIRWLEGMWAQQFRIRQFDLTPPPTSGEIRLHPSRLSIPAPLLPICTTEHYERLLHSYGASFPDSVRIFARDFSNPPDVIAYPRHAQDILALYVRTMMGNTTLKQSTRRMRTKAGLPGSGASAFCACPASAKN